ncbi:MAG TPA: hypothetical protein VKB93_29865 [Thermoanaerobaculia bacterium]|nr:hypothetical protein [Thermoanaerobaculia bacterium]
MTRLTTIGCALVLAAPLVAQQPATTSTSSGDENASIRASATAQAQQETPPGTIRRPASPRPPGSAVTPRQNAPREAKPRSSGPTARQRAAAAGNPDVYLEVPNLSVEQILLEVDNLEVHLALDARVANLVSLKAGVDATIGSVKLEIRGVEAEAYLTVRLDNVARILDRTLTTIDNNPQLLEKLLTTVDRTVGTVGGVANTALQPGGVVSQTVGTVGRTLENVTAPGGLLTQTVNTLGQTVQRTLDATGNIVERTLDTTGNLVGEKNVGRLLDLPVLQQTTNAAGQLVKQVRDTSGAVIEYTLDSAGKIVGSRVISQPQGGRRR